MPDSSSSRKKKEKFIKDAVICLAFRLPHLSFSSSSILCDLRVLVIFVRLLGVGLRLCFV